MNGIRLRRSRGVMLAVSILKLAGRGCQGKGAGADRDFAPRSTGRRIRASHLRSSSTPDITTTTAGIDDMQRRLNIERWLTEILQ